MITTIEVNGSCLDVDKCIDVAVEAPPPAELLFVVVKSRIEEELGKLLTVLCVEDIDFTLLIRPGKITMNWLWSTKMISAQLLDLIAVLHGLFKSYDIL